MRKRRHLRKEKKSMLGKWYEQRKGLKQRRVVHSPGRVAPVGQATLWLKGLCSAWLWKGWTLQPWWEQHELSCPTALGLNPSHFPSQLIECVSHLTDASLLSLCAKGPVIPSWQDGVRTKQDKMRKAQHTAGPDALWCSITFFFYPNCTIY